MQHLSVIEEESVFEEKSVVFKESVIEEESVQGNGGKEKSALCRGAGVFLEFEMQLPITCASGLSSVPLSHIAHSLPSTDELIVSPRNSASRIRSALPVNASLMHATGTTTCRNFLRVIQ